MTTILGIETSCDETSAAVLSDGKVRSNIISSQLIHSGYGGVVPELASRAHMRLIIRVVEAALKKANVQKEECQSVAATYGPGLAGALLVGLSFGKGLAYGLGVPFTGVNHIEGHLYSHFLEQPTSSYPFLSLIVSGGHTLLVLVRAPFEHTVLGQTRDDAAGEAFDKVAKMLGLGYPGGPLIDRLAGEGDPHGIGFPRSFLEDGSYDFSFSGLKTSVLYYLRRNGLEGVGVEQNRQLCADICASFQEAVIDVLVKKAIRAAAEFGTGQVAIAGGVSANSRLRLRMGKECKNLGLTFFAPSTEYSMDNAAMIAYVAWMKFEERKVSDLELNACPNLSLS